MGAGSVVRAVARNRAGNDRAVPRHRGIDGPLLRSPVRTPNGGQDEAQEQAE